MDRKVLVKMTARELIELVERQNQAINSLDRQRFDSNAVIEHLVTATENMRNLRYHDIERDHDWEYLNDFVRQMHTKYPVYLVSAEYPEKIRRTSEKIEEVLKTLEKLYNDFTMRPDECEALDFAIKFIKENTTIFKEEKRNDS